MKNTLKPTLLVIDDDPGVRGLFQTALESAGYPVLIAQSGRHSLNLLSRYTVDAMRTGRCVSEKWRITAQ